MSLRILSISAMLAIVVGVTGCKTDAVKGMNIGGLDVGQLADNIGGLREVDQPEEIEMGRAVAETLLGAAPPVNDPELQRYVNTVGRWVALQSERPDLPWHFVVTASEAVNAAATPGGNVVVTVGMLRVLTDESQLAGVLGHETAHVVRKHHLDALRKGSFIGLLAQGAQVASQGSRNQELVEALVGPTKDLYLRGLDKSDEFEADRMGVVLATRAGYDPWGLPGAVQTLSAMKPDASAVALLFKTHPAPSARLEKLAAAMGTSFDSIAGASNAERYRRATQRALAQRQAQ